MFLKVSQIRDIRFRWFRVEPWKRWCHSLLLKITEGSLSSPAADEDLGESPAFEVRIQFPLVSLEHQLWGRP